MKRRNIWLPLSFLCIAMAVLAHGLYTWRDRAKALGPLAPLVYEGTGAHSKELVKTLSSHKIEETTRKQFKDFSIAEDKKDPVGMRKVLTNMADTYKQHGESDMAVELNKRAANIGKSNGLHTEAGENLKSIGQIYHEAAKFDDASHNFKQSAIEFRQAKAWQHLDTLLVAWAKTEAKRGHNTQAKKLKKQAEQIAKKLKSQTNKKVKDIGIALKWDDPDDPNPTSKTSTSKIAAAKPGTKGKSDIVLDESTGKGEKPASSESEPSGNVDADKSTDDKVKEGEQSTGSDKKDSVKKQSGAKGTGKAE